MAIGQCKDIEQGEINDLQDLERPLIHEEKAVSFKNDEEENGSMNMVLLSTFVAVCGSFEFGSCVGYSAPTQSAIMEDLSLTTAQYSMFGSILTIGAMIGAVTSGRISDYIGRKGAMRMSAIFCITGWLAVFFSRGYLSLDMGRLFTGYGIGVFSFVVPIFIAEIAPKNLRGGLTTLNQLMIVTGSSTAFLIGSVISWRILALTGLVPCIFLLVGLVFVPESPRWLAKVGREKEFQVALQKLRGKDVDVTREAAEIQVYIQTFQSLPKARILDLFKRQYIRFVFIGVAIMICQQFVGINGIGFYVSQTFVSAGFSSGTIGTIAYACIQVPITAVGALLMDKSGRKPLIMVSAAGTFLGCFIAGVSFFLKAHNLLLGYVPIMAVSGVLIFISAFSIGMGAVPWLIMSEILPINIKGVAGSLVVLVNWLGAWLVSYTFNFLLSWSSAGTFFLYSGFSLLSILFVAKFVPETKGKTLEEIQESINS
ncbi:sugar transporter ERD6-like 16 isoform X1 [Ricinus communis]|uniref:sugar transporter ERD6-like 16 isoform X1 n=2 Tax=Ricinus communis TaxID=3988 RepID=UPI00077226CB|nr:sugar transporter ERD6-like 16 isoform X1 [Ricinus communis]|eukprot:XP_015573342.1 sugar transporter ERD6-like 16 isoform X1 [Ricinus communis]